MRALLAKLIHLLAPDRIIPGLAALDHMMDGPMHEQVRVAPDGVGQVPAADREPVAITAGRDDGQIRACRL